MFSFLSLRKGRGFAFTAFLLQVRLLLTERPAVHRHREVDRVSQDGLAGIITIRWRYPGTVRQVERVDELVARLPDVLLAFCVPSDGYRCPAVFTLGGGIDLPARIGSDF